MTWILVPVAPVQFAVNTRLRNLVGGPVVRRFVADLGPLTIRTTVHGVPVDGR